MDMQDRYGDTALHIASRHGYTEVVKELLSYRANKDIVNQVRLIYYTSLPGIN